MSDAFVEVIRAVIRTQKTVPESIWRSISAVQAAPVRVLAPACGNFLFMSDARAGVVTA